MEPSAAPQNTHTPRNGRAVWAWALIGFVGSLIVALAGPRAVDSPGSAWWYLPGVPGTRDAATAVVYVGITLLCVAWLGLGRHARGNETAWLGWIAAAWMLPLALGPALFSRDLYSYLAQGTILHLGRNPYHTAPVALAGLGHAHVLNAVSPFWRHTTAPYGPLFLGAVSLIVGITGQHLIAGALVIRALELVGVALLAVYVPRLARALGADPARASWLAVCSPLVTLGLVAAGHNDVLMAGLLVAGVTVALRGRPLYGVAVCAVAGAFKLPALAGVIFIALGWARAEPTRAKRAEFLLAALATTVGVLAVVSIATGTGVSWVSGSLFSTPAKVRLAITPGTGVGWTAASLLHDVGVHVNSRSFESAFVDVTFAITGVLALVLLYRLKIPRLALYLGLLLVVAAAGGPAAWPWYFIWGLALLAACPGPQEWPVLVLGSVVGAFLVKPNGILALPLHTAPAVIAVYAVVAVIVWRSSRRGGGRPSGHRGAGTDRTASSAEPKTLAGVVAHDARCTSP